MPIAALYDNVTTYLCISMSSYIYKCTISNFQPTRLAKGTDPSRFLALELMKTKSPSMPVSIIMWTRNYR